MYNKNPDLYESTPKSLLVDAVAKNDEIGSCTCCLVTLDEQAKVIMTANLGDSGYMLLRQSAGKY